MPVRITFEAQTSDELLELVRAWALGSEPVSRSDAVDDSEGPGPADRIAETAPRLYESLVSGVKGERSRRFLRQVAEASVKGEAVPLTQALVSEYGGSKNVAMAGIVSGANRRMKKVAGRLLIERGPRGYAMSQEDAELVLAAFASENGNG